MRYQASTVASPFLLKIISRRIILSLQKLRVVIQRMKLLSSAARGWLCWQFVPLAMLGWLILQGKSFKAQWTIDGGQRCAATPKSADSRVPNHLCHIRQLSFSQNGIRSHMIGPGPNEIFKVLWPNRGRNWCFTRPIYFPSMCLRAAHLCDR